MMLKASRPEALLRIDVYKKLIERGTPHKMAKAVAYKWPLTIVRAMHRWYYK